MCEQATVHSGAQLGRCEKLRKVHFLRATAYVAIARITVTIHTAGRVYRQRRHVHTANEKINLLIYCLLTQSTSGAAHCFRFAMANDTNCFYEKKME